MSPRFEAEPAWDGRWQRRTPTRLSRRARDIGRIEQRLEACARRLAWTAPKRIGMFDITHHGRGHGGLLQEYGCHEAPNNALLANTAGITGGDDFAAMRRSTERRHGKVAAGEGVPRPILTDGVFGR